MAQANPRDRVLSVAALDVKASERRVLIKDQKGVGPGLVDRVANSVVVTKTIGVQCRSRIVARKDGAQTVARLPARRRLHPEARRTASNSGRAHRKVAAPAKASAQVHSAHRLNSASNNSPRLPE